VGQIIDQPRPMRRELQLLILDNYDSYTYNLAQMLSQHCLHPPIVVPNDRYSSWAALVAALPHFDAIVISPGPGHPACAADFGLCAQAYRCGLPVLGVCLGHQGLALAFGGTVHRAPVVMHGRLSSIVHDGGGLFEGVPSPVSVVRYHSLLVDGASLPSCLCVTARTADDGLVMAMQHATRPIYGVQFHPESVCTAHGDAMLANFVRLASQVRPYLSHARGELAPHTATLPLSPPTPPPPTPPSRVRRHLLVCEPQLPRSLPAEEVFTNLFGSAPMSFWLDAAGGSRRPRYSYMGCAGGPYSHLVCQRESGVYTLRLAAGDAEHARSELVPGTTPGTTIDEYIRAALAPWADPVTLRCQVPTIAGSQPILEQAPVASFSTPGGERAGLLTPELLFRGGFVGYLSYEAWRHLGPVAQEPSMRARRREAAAPSATPPSAPPLSSRELGDPAGAEAAFMFADRLLAFDHAEGRLLLLCLCEGPTTASALSWLARQQRALRRLAAMPPSQPTHAPPTAQAPASAGDTMQFVSDRGREHYLSDIRAIGDFLAAGESYEVCLTTTFRSPECPPPLDLYRRLRRTNPTPHAAYLRFDPRRLCAQAQAQTPSDSPTSVPAAPADGIGPGGVVICCSSPERFMRVDRSRAVECKPIKGTAARGATPAEDAAVAIALRTDEKSIAENLMIVDLIRNDLGRVCAAGSVSVPKLMHIETFQTVHQLVTTVCGQLDPREDAISAVAAAFPPGSMTGAPKARTMRLIDDLELQIPRGVYSGALGFFSVDGSADLNVVIRAAFLDAHGVSVAAGGAIVALSKAQDEWEEVLLKARPVMSAIAACMSAGTSDAYEIVTRRTPRPLHERPLAQPTSTSLDVFETMLYAPTLGSEGAAGARANGFEHGFYLLPMHLARLVRSSAALGVTCVPPPARLLEHLLEAAKRWPASDPLSRVRLSLSTNGECRIERWPMPAGSGPSRLPNLPRGLRPAPPLAMEALLDTHDAEEARRVVLDVCPVHSCDPSLVHKTSARHVYDAARARAGIDKPIAVADGRAPAAAKPFDVLLYNEAGELTECCIANVALEDGRGGWATPPLECGLLPGLLRAELLMAKALYEAVVTLDELVAALRDGRRLVAFNSLRGVYLIRLDLQSQMLDRKVLGSLQPATPSKL
jgi:para-aminobenzoate synthetase